MRMADLTQLTYVMRAPLLVARWWRPVCFFSFHTKHLPFGDFWGGLPTSPVACDNRPEVRELQQKYIVTPKLLLNQIRPPNDCRINNSALCKTYLSYARTLVADLTQLGAGFLVGAGAF